MGICTLDYTLESSLRLTFQWHSLTRKAHLESVQRKTFMLRAAAGKAPDLVLASTGTWDMLVRKVSSRVCEPIERLTQTLFGRQPASSAAVSSEAPLAGAPLRVLYGYFSCPQCPTPSAPATAPRCGNFAGASNVQTQTMTAHTCARAVAASQQWVYLDVARMTAAMPPLLSSPCGNHHPFGLLAETEAHLLGSLVLAAGLESISPDRTTDELWRQWRSVGTFLRCRSATPCTGVACPKLSNANETASPRPRARVADARSIVGACPSET